MEKILITKQKIFIVENNDFFRKGLKLVINNFANVEVIGEAGNGQEFLDTLKSKLPDLVLMDIKMPIMNGIEATQAAVQKYPAIKIAALSMFGDEEYLQSMIQAGAVGFMLKDISKTDLERAIQQLLKGNNYYSEELLTFFTKKYINTEAEKFIEEHNLTKRELEILQLISKGLTNAEIAEIFHISSRTVEGHKTNIIVKTGSKNLVDLLIYAIKNKVVIIS